MNASVQGGRPVAWEDAGRQIAPVLGSYSAVVVTSADPIAAAHVALGIARAEARHRRAVVGDLVGDLPPLRDLVTDDDPHGISDSILYGVSFNKIGRQIEGTENLYVMPSGTEPVLSDEIIASSRWKRLGAGFTEVGALLLLVARSDSPGLAALIDQLDGVVVVKDSDLPNAPSALVLARVASPTKTLKVLLFSQGAGGIAAPRLRGWYAGAAGIALITLAAVAFAFMRGRVSDSARTDAGSAAAPPLPVPAPPPAETVFVAPPANASDSASAAAFAVELLAANTPEGANFVLRKDGSVLPSATVAPVPIGPERTTWYKVIVGAYTRRSQADSLLLALRESRILRDSAGTVLRVPLALLVDSVPTQGGIDDAVRAAVGKYTARGLPVYALMQNDGGARLYAGAFDRPDESAELLKTLRGAGLTPVLVYRTGRTP